MHLLGECFLIALGTNRTMVTLLDEDWFADLYQVITPLSAIECDKRKAENAAQWQGKCVSWTPDVRGCEMPLSFYFAREGLSLVADYKSYPHCIRGFRLKRVTSGGINLHGVEPEQHSYEALMSHTETQKGYFKNFELDFPRSQNTKKN